MQQESSKTQQTAHTQLYLQSIHCSSSTGAHWWNQWT